MTTKPNGNLLLEEITAKLCEPAACEGVSHRPLQDEPMPSVAALAEVVELLKAILFPGFFGDADITPSAMAFHVGAGLDKVQRLLGEQIKRGLCFAACEREAGPDADCADCEAAAREKTMAFLTQLPEIRRLLATDVQAAYVGDPAAKSPGEAIFCYPSITALAHQRLAHALHNLGVYLIPRIITEMAHSATGIDIHPGATIGEHFFIDHGTGVVIGETALIGKNVRLYQGVTLGAKSFPKDGEGQLIKDLPRHPIVEDDVIIYAGATILGRITIGKGSVVGGNVWLTEDLPAGSLVVQTPAGGTSIKTK